jgi:glycosyltransferase involved in cell wall biosynthesis
VLFVAARYLPDLGGIETHIHEVGRRLAAAGDIDLTVLATDRTRERTVYERVDGYTVVRRPAYPSRRDFYFAPGVPRYIHEHEVDIVHCQGIHTLVPPMAMTAARVTRVPYVVTFHTGGHSDPLRNRMRGAQWRLLAPLLRSASALVAVSPFEKDMFQDVTGLPDERFRVIQNGGSLPPLVAPTERVPGLVISSGRLEHYKGHQRVIESLPHLRRLHPGATLRILGAGPYEQELRSLIRTLGLDDVASIDSIPPGDRSAMATELAQAQVFVTMSDYEAHPVAVMEALASGLPVVGLDSAGVGDLVRDGHVTGVATDCTAEELAAAIGRTLAGEHRRSLELPTWDDAAARLAELYRELDPRRSVASLGMDGGQR